MISAYAPFTALQNVTGQPAISLPLHWTASGLPVGCQFVARFGEEETLLSLAAELEEAAPWEKRRPRRAQVRTPFAASVRANLRLKSCTGVDKLLVRLVRRMSRSVLAAKGAGHPAGRTSNLGMTSGVASSRRSI